MRRSPTIFWTFASFVAGATFGVALTLCKPLIGSSSSSASRRRIFSPRATRSRAQRALDLCRSVLGNDKASIAAIFGPPHASAGFSAVAPAMLVRADYLHADTWYYPLDRSEQTALAVYFNEGIAHDAQLVSVGNNNV